MQKFSNPIKEENILLETINRELSIIVDDPDKYFNEDMEITGKNTLIQEINDFFQKQIDIKTNEILNDLKSKSINFINEKYIDNRIKKLKQLKNENKKV